MRQLAKKGAVTRAHKERLLKAADREVGVRERITKTRRATLKEAGGATTAEDFGMLGDAIRESTRGVRRLAGMVVGAVKDDFKEYRESHSRGVKRAKSALTQEDFREAAQHIRGLASAASTRTLPDVSRSFQSALQRTLDEDTAAAAQAKRHLDTATERVRAAMQEAQATLRELQENVRREPDI